MKLKDRELEGKLASFELSTFQGIKEPMAWSSESWTWGSTSKRAQNMLFWQQDHLHSPITRGAASVGDPSASKALFAKAVNAFDTVQKFMGERNTLKMPFRLVELLTDAVLNDSLRDEVYLHIIKQCTRNGEDISHERTPGWRSHVGRGLELMALCALVFPPSPPFQNYVEAFVRNPQFAQWETQYGLRGLLRRRAYHGSLAAAAIPTEGEFAQQCRMDNKRYGDGATSAIFTKHLRLDAFKETKKAAKGAKGGAHKDKSEKKEKKKKGRKSSSGTSERHVAQPGSAAAAAAPSGQWEAAVDPTSGNTYYYNTETKETRSIQTLCHTSGSEF